LYIAVAGDGRYLVHWGECFEDAYIYGRGTLWGCMVDYVEGHNSVSSWTVSKLEINVRDAAGGRYDRARNVFSDDSTMQASSGQEHGTEVVKSRRRIDKISASGAMLKMNHKCSQYNPKLNPSPGLPTFSSMMEG
jgi:hypothetical protein